MGSDQLLVSLMGMAAMKPTWQIQEITTVRCLGSWTVFDLMYYASGSWWTWTTTSSSITPTKTPSSSTLKATQTPIRSHWQRSEKSSADGKGLRGEAIKEKLWLLVGHNLWGCYWLADKLTDSIGDSPSVRWRSEVHADTSDPSLTLLHYEASRNFCAGVGTTQNKKRTLQKFSWTG